MADEYRTEHHQEEIPEVKAEVVKVDDPAPIEVTDRGRFDNFIREEDEKAQDDQEVIIGEFKKVHISENETAVEEKQHGAFLQKLRRSDSSSSSSSNDEEDEESKKKKEKKSLKDRINEEKHHEKQEEATAGAVEFNEEKINAVEEEVVCYPEEKEKIEEVPPQVLVTAPAPAPGYAAVEKKKEKKGLLGKIKEKILGFQKHEEN
ncbi:hypothetical protein Dimus_034474 [Dionaea muscipula]